MSFVKKIEAAKGKEEKEKSSLHDDHRLETKNVRILEDLNRTLTGHEHKDPHIAKIHEDVKKHLEKKRQNVEKLTQKLEKSAPPDSFKNMVQSFSEFIKEKAVTKNKAAFKTQVVQGHPAYMALIDVEGKGTTFTIEIYEHGSNLYVKVNPARVQEFKFDPHRFKRWYDLSRLKQSWQSELLDVKKFKVPGATADEITSTLLSNGWKLRTGEKAPKSIEDIKKAFPNVTLKDNKAIVIKRIGKEISSLHKAELNLGSNERSLESRIKSFADASKAVGANLDLTIEFEDGDYYDHTNYYDIPVFSVENNKFNKGSTQSNDVPKSWGINLSYSLTLPEKIKKEEIDKLSSAAKALESLVEEIANERGYHL